MGTGDHSGRAHAKLAPSSAHRWRNCPGSPEAESHHKDQGSVFAAQGTAAHELLERCGVNGFNPKRFLGETITVKGRNGGQDETFTVDEEMVDAVEVHLDVVRHATGPRDVLKWEERYPLPFLPGTQWGTADTTLYKRAERGLVVIDFKYGQGEVVEAAENSQGLCYAGGAVYALGLPVDWVEIVIVQPRAWHPDGPVRRWRISAVELMDRLADLGEAGERANQPGAPRNPGKWCKWCKAAGTCSALANFALAEAQMVFQPEPADPEALTPEQVGKALGKAGIIEGWIKALHAHAYAQLQEGRPIPGYKLVEKRPRRQWADDNAAQIKLKQLGLTDEQTKDVSVISPAQAEKKLGKGAKPEIATQVISVSSGLTIAPESDSRPESKGLTASGTDYSAVFQAQPTKNT